MQFPAKSYKSYILHHSRAPAVLLNSQANTQSLINQTGQGFSVFEPTWVYEPCKPEAHRTEKLIPVESGLNDIGARCKINGTR